YELVPRFFSPRQLLAQTVDGLCNPTKLVPRTGKFDGMKHRILPDKRCTFGQYGDPSADRVRDHACEDQDEADACDEQHDSFGVSAAAERRMPDHHPCREYGQSI